jgi:antibiotic biosynthesis monooxygenase (ABM) superfamily enzyme
MTNLTGEFTSEKLKKIAPGVVTVTIARTVRPEYTAFFSAWSDQAVASLANYPGCLGAAVLASGDESNVSQIVFRFADAISLRRWERSDERISMLEEIDGIVVEERVTTVVGEDAFFSSLAAQKPARSWPLRFAVDVAWVFPVAFVWSAVLAPKFSELSLSVRTLLSAAVITLVLEVVVAPVRHRLRARRSLPLG